MLIVGIFSIWRNVGVYLYVNCPNVKDFNNNIHTVNTRQLDSVHCGNVGTDIQRKVQWQIPVKKM